MSRRIVAGLTLSIEIFLDEESLEGEQGYALGACVSDLQREGWMLEGLNHEEDGARARLSRHWEVGVFARGAGAVSEHDLTAQEYPDKSRAVGP